MLKFSTQGLLSEVLERDCAVFGVKSGPFLGKDNTVEMVLALHLADLCLISNTLHGPQKTTRSHPEHRAPLNVVPKQQRPEVLACIPLTHLPRNLSFYKVMALMGWGDR